jgi:2Fe-2S ferredoxin
MTTVTYILRDNSTQEVRVDAGVSLMTAAIFNNVPGISGECGGCCSCATCHIYVVSSSGDLAPADETERGLLTGVAAELKDESRLACQLVASTALGAITVRVPERQA